MCHASTCLSQQYRQVELGTTIVSSCRTLRRDLSTYKRPLARFISIMGACNSHLYSSQIVIDRSDNSDSGLTAGYG